MKLATKLPQLTPADVKWQTIFEMNQRASDPRAHKSNKHLKDFPEQLKLYFLIQGTHSKVVFCLDNVSH